MDPFQRLHNRFEDGQRLGAGDFPALGGEIGFQAHPVHIFHHKVGSTIVNESEIDVENLINDVQGVQIEIENKVNTDLSNCTKPYITNTYSNGASWYRVYSDGWCEQGGQIANGGNNVTVALLKPYVNTNYLAIGCAITSNNGKVGYASVGIKTTTTCSFINQSYAYPVGWKTEGYIF